jgi:DNA-binding CsgD family transcriptional regulator
MMGIDNVRSSLESSMSRPDPENAPAYELSYHLTGCPNRHTQLEAAADFLAKAIGGESIGCCAIDLPGRAVDRWSSTGGEDAGALFKAVHQDVPTIRHYVNHPGDTAAVRLSDLISALRWREHPAYRDCYAKLGLRYHIVIPIELDTRAARGVGWFLNRASRDFTDPDLDLARTAQRLLTLVHRTPPHLALDPAVRSSAEPREEARRRVGLTPREHDVLSLLAEGLTARQIASLRRISIGTVNKHLQRIYDKLGVHDRLQAANQARRRGLV